MRTFFDNEIGIAEPQVADKLFDNSVALHRLLAIRICTSRDHVVSPTRVLLALGIVLDFDRAALYMPPGKLEIPCLLIQETKEKAILSRYELQRLLGLLNHRSEVILAGRIFTNRLLQSFKQMSDFTNYFEPNEGFKKDLRWWDLAAPYLNFQSMMIL